MSGETDILGHWGSTPHRHEKPDSRPGWHEDRMVGQGAIQLCQEVFDKIFLHVPSRADYFRKLWKAFLESNWSTPFPLRGLESLDTVV